MSGIINRLLDEARAGKKGPHVIAEYETLEEAQASHPIKPVTNLGKMNPAMENLLKTTPARDKTPETAVGIVTEYPQEKPCCKKASPCVHWQFGGEGWQNSLSGRIREVV